MKKNLTWPHYIVLVLLLLVVCYVGLGAFYIVDLNEGLYAEIPREMLRTGHYVIPHLNYVPYIEKPPLLYWCIAASYKLFGVNAFAARFVPATAMGLCSLLLLWFGKQINNLRVGWIAAMMLASSIGFWLIGRTILFDMLLTLLFSAALLLFYRWFATDKKVYLRIAYVFLALSVLCKGFLVLVLSPAIVLLFMWWTKAGWKKTWKILDPIGIVLFLLVVLPWHLLATAQQPGFAWHYFVNEQINRFLNTRYPQDYHTGSVFYYLPRIIVYIFPWSFLLPYLLTKRSVLERTQANLWKFLVLWVLVPLLFFSLSGDKGDYYMVIAMPALILLLAMRLDVFFEKKNSLPFFIVFSVAVALLWLGFAIVMLASYGGIHMGDIFTQPESLKQGLLVIFVLTVIYGIFGLVFSVKYFKDPFISFVFLAGLILPVAAMAVFAKQRLQVAYTQQPIAEYILQHGKNEPVFLYQNYERLSSLVFYLQKRVYVIDSRSQDLYFGETTPEAKEWFISMQQFKQNFSGKATYVVMRDRYLSQFNRAVAPLKFCVKLRNADIDLLSSAC